MLGRESWHPITRSIVFVEMWLTHCGVPEVVVVDQGGLFACTLAEEREEIGIDIRITGELHGMSCSKDMAGVG